MNANLLEVAKSLPLSERAELFDALWETLRQDGYEPVLSPGQAAELDSRREDHRRNPADTVPWEQIKTQTEAQFRRGS